MMIEINLDRKQLDILMHALYTANSVYDDRCAESYKSGLTEWVEHWRDRSYEVELLIEYISSRTPA